jgi:hypothetical protein
LEGDVATSKSVIDGLKSYLTDRVSTDTTLGLKFSQLTDTATALFYSAELITRIGVKNPEPALNASFHGSMLNNPAFKSNFSLTNLTFVQGFNQFKAARLVASVIGGSTIKTLIMTEDSPSVVERKILDYLTQAASKLQASSSKELESVSVDLFFFNPEIYSVIQLELMHLSVSGKGYTQKITGKTFPAGDVLNDPKRSFSDTLTSTLKFLGFLEFLFFLVEFVLDLTQQIRSSLRDHMLMIETYEAVNGLYLLAMVIHFYYFVRIQQTSIQNPSQPLVDEATFELWMNHIAEQKSLEQIQGILMVLASLRLIMMLMANFYELFQLLKVTFKNTGRVLVSFLALSFMIFICFVLAAVLILPKVDPIYKSLWGTASVMLQSILGRPDFTSNSLKKQSSSDIMFTLINVLFFIYFSAFAFEYLLAIQYHYYFDVQKKYKIPILVKYRFLESRQLSLASKFKYLFTFKFKKKDFEAEERKKNQAKEFENAEESVSENGHEDAHASLNIKPGNSTGKEVSSNRIKNAQWKESFSRSIGQLMNPLLALKTETLNINFTRPKAKPKLVLKQNITKPINDVPSKNQIKAKRDEASEYLLGRTELKDIFTMNLNNFITQGEESFYSRNQYLNDAQWISTVITDEITNDYSERVEEHKANLVTNFVKCISYFLYIWLYSIITTRHLNIEESLKFNIAYVRFVNESRFQNPRYKGDLNFNMMRVFTDMQELVIQPTFITNNLTYNEMPTYLIGRLAKHSYFTADNYYSIPNSNSIVHWVGTNMKLDSRTEIGNVFVNTLQKPATLLQNSIDGSVGIWPYFQNTQLTPEILGETLASENLKISAQDLIDQVANLTNPYISREVSLSTDLVARDRLHQSIVQPKPKYAKFIEELPKLQIDGRSDPQHRLHCKHCTHMIVLQA